MPVLFLSLDAIAPIRSQNNQIVKLYLAEIWNLQNISIADSIIGDDFIDPASTTG